MNDRPSLPAESAEIPEEFQILMMGYLDGELDDPERKRFLAFIEENEAGRLELARYRHLVDVANSLRLREPQDDEADRYWGGIYNRMERRGGWMLVVLGVLFLTGALVFQVSMTVMLPWYLKVGIAALATGFVVLFLSVLRLRIRTLPYDRYREVKR